MEQSPDFDPGVDSHSVAAVLDSGFATLDSDRRRLDEELLALSDCVGGPAGVAVALTAYALSNDSSSDDDLLALARLVSSLLPDRETFHTAVRASTDGDIDPLVDVIDSYCKRAQYRDHLSALAAGDPFDGIENSSALLASAREATSDGVAGFETIRNLVWLFTDADLHEEVVALLADRVRRPEPGDDLESDRVWPTEQARQTWTDIAVRIETTLFGDIQRQGFIRLNPLYFARSSPSDPGTCWRTGFDLNAVKLGYAYERPEVVSTLLESLQSGDHRIVVGRPGSGKSTICKSVACQWYEQNTGPVIYRSGRAEPDFDDCSVLLDALQEADGHTLVVVEDTIRQLNDEILSVLETAAESDDFSASFLFEARRSELDGLDRQFGDDQRGLAAALQRLRGSVLIDYEVPGLDDDDCAGMIEHFESITETEIVQSTDALIERTRRNQGVGGDDIIHFAYHLVRSVEGFETGLEKNVEAVYDRLVNPDGPLVSYGDLPARVGLAVNILKAANVPVHRELLHTLSDDHEAIEAVIEELSGELLFDASGTDAFKTNHELWASLYVRMLLEKEETAVAHEMFANCVNALFSIFNPGTRQEIERRVEEEATATEPVRSTTGVTAGGSLGADSGKRSYLSAILPAAKVVDKVTDLGRRWPVLAPLYGTSESSKLELPAVCSTMTIANFVAARGDMYLNSGDPSRAIAEYRAAQEIVEGSDSINDQLKQKMESIYYNNVGDVALNRGDFDDARNYYEQALKIARSIRYRDGEAKSLTNLGGAAWSAGDREPAVDHYEQALEIYRSIGDRHEGARCLKNLGLVAWGRGNFEEADRFLDRSIKIYREIGDRLGEAGCLNNRGLVALERATLDKADDWFRRSLETYREIGDRYGESIALVNVGTVAMDRGNLDEAERYQTRSLEITRDTGDRQGEAACLDELGQIARKRGEFETADRWFCQSLDIHREVGNRVGQANVLRNLGTVARENGRLDEAESYHERALEIHREVGPSGETAECLHDLGMDASAREDLSTALNYFERACELFLELDSAGGVDALVDLLSICERLGADEKQAEWCSRGMDFAGQFDNTEALASYCKRESPHT